MLTSKDVPAEVLARADCVIVLPSVKKFAFGVGGTGGRGPMTCRGGKNFSGRWSAPAMFSIGGCPAEALEAPRREQDFRFGVSDHTVDGFSGHPGFEFGAVGDQINGSQLL
jgi:lipid-binding SYLF domain-containing protein